VRCLVVGGTGFVGVAACKELMRRGVETIAASRTHHPYGTFTSHVVLDRADDDRVAQVLEDVGPDILLDLSGSAPEDADRYLRHFRGERCVFVSSSDDLPAVVIRTTAVMGAGDPTRRIAGYLQRLEDGGPVLLPAESMDRDAGLAWNRDLGYAAALACDPGRTLSGVYEVGFGSVSLKQLVLAIGRALGTEPRIVTLPGADIPPGASPYGSGRPLDLARSRRELGFEPSALGDALAETLAWYRVARPSHPGYADRPRELEIAAQLSD
jgi:nucleoside-diphosphate-sugar epimerase